MKYSLIFLLTAVCSASLFSKPLKDCSIVLWPKYDWIGGRVESVADEVLVNGDFIVFPGALGMKGWFRSDEYQIDKRRVMLELDHATMNPDYYFHLEKHQEGIGGYFVHEFDAESRSALGKKNRRRFYEYLKTNQQSLSYCVDKKAVDRPANLSFLGNRCDQLVIYYDRALSLDPEKTIEFFRSACASAKSRAKEAKIIAGIELKLDEEQSQTILELFKRVSDEVDGFLIVFEGSASQKSTAIQIMKSLRS